MTTFNKYKTVGYILAPLLILLPAADAAAQDMPDSLAKYYPVDVDHPWATDTLLDFVDADIINGYREADGTYTIKPDNLITRAEFVKIMVTALDLKGIQNAKPFTDIKGQWFEEYVKIASSNGLVNGITDSEFAPNKQITRGEIAMMTVRAFANTVSFTGEAKQFSDIAGFWGKLEVEKAAKAGIINGYTDTDKFMPFANATRAEAMTMLQRGLHKEQTDLPSNDLLFSSVMLEDENNYRAVAAQDYMQLRKTAQSKAGYQKAFTEWAADLFSQWHAEGSMTDMEQSGHYNLEVIYKSNRFALVAVDLVSYDVVITENGSDERYTVDGKRYFYLKKQAGAEFWAVYSCDSNLMF